MKKIKKKVINLIILIATFFNKNRVIKTKQSTTNANLGCGLRCLPNWVNIDGSLTALFGSSKSFLINKLLFKLSGARDYYSLREYDHIVRNNNLHFYNLAYGIPLKNSSIEVVYSSHFLEHLNKENGRHFIKECFRILKTDGLMRLVLPDLDIAINNYYKNGEIEKMLDLFFYTSETNDFSAHKYGYNFESLKNVLEEAGFKEVKKMEYQKGLCPDIDLLDYYPDYSLHVECRK